MFEKEAKEYARENTSYYGTDDCYDKDTEKVEQTFKDGAKFGYNKALKENGDLRDCCNCKHWHYSTRSLSYYCDKTSKCDDSERQCYRCVHWEL